MKRSLLTLLLMAALPLAALSQASRTAKPAKPAAKPSTEKAPPVEVWKDFTSKEGGFTVSMPGTPIDERQENDLRYRLNIGPRVYGVMRTPRFQRAETVIKTLENMADGLVQVSEGRVLNKGSVSVGGFPGVSIKYETLEPPGITHANYFLINEQVYVVIAFTRNGNTEDNAERFLQSFRLLKK